MQLLDTKKLFYEIDTKLFTTLLEITTLMKELKKGMDDNDISPTLLIREERYLAEPMIEILQKMSTFVDEYKKIKETWRLTNA